MLDIREIHSGEILLPTRESITNYAQHVSEKLLWKSYRRGAINYKHNTHGGTNQ